MSAAARAELREIFAGTLVELDAFQSVRRSVRCTRHMLYIGGLPALDLSGFRRVVILGCGKAAVPMADAVDEVLPREVPVQGCVVTNDTATADDRPRRFEVSVGEHPVPGAASYAAGRRLLELARAADSSDTLVLFVVSGGASALAESPGRGVSEADLSAIHAELVSCGATIAEINAVRRVLSGIKDGRLAAAAGRAKRISLLLSDVNPGEVSSLGSGPTVAPLEGAIDLAEVVLDRYRLATTDVGSIRAAFADVQPRANRVSDYIVIGDNRTAVDAAVRVARARGHDAHADWSIDPEPPVEQLARWLARPIDRQLRVSGGEAICPVRGDGRGGRNLETVLRAAIELDKTRVPVAVLSAGTDGIDGNSPAAGAVADRHTVARARALGLDAERSLQNSDAFPLFEALGDAIVTGATGTNVRDLRLCFPANDPSVGSTV